MFYKLQLKYKKFNFTIKSYDGLNSKFKKKKNLIVYMGLYLLTFRLISVFVLVFLNLFT